MALIRHLKLNDNAASTTVIATVGVDGSLGGGDNTSAKQTSGPGGSITYAFDLNGTDDRVILGAADVYDFTTSTAFSVSLWFNADVLSGYLIGRAGSDFRGISIASTTTIRLETSGSSITFTVPTMTTGTWYHIFVTRTTGQSARVWLNGVESSSGALSLNNNFTFDSIGRRNTTYFNGRVSEFLLWNTDESANILTYYNEGVSTSTSRIINPGSGLIVCSSINPLRTEIPF